MQFELDELATLSVTPADLGEQALYHFHTQE